MKTLIEYSIEYDRQLKQEMNKSIRYTDRISLRTAKLAKELKFIDTCNGFYEPNGDFTDDCKIDNNYAGNTIYCAPTQLQYQYWLIQKHGVAVIVDLDNTLSWYWKIVPLRPQATLQITSNSSNVWNGQMEDALEDGLYVASVRILDALKVPRSLDQYTPAERAIYDAVIEVEKMGADVKLTNAVIKLNEAKDLVESFITGKESPNTFMKGE